MLTSHIGNAAPIGAVLVVLAAVLALRTVRRLAGIVVTIGLLVGGLGLAGVNLPPLPAL